MDSSILFSKWGFCISHSQYRGSDKSAQLGTRRHKEWIQHSMQTLRYMSVQAVMHGSASGLLGTQPRHLFIFAQRIKHGLGSLSCYAGKST